MNIVESCLLLQNYTLYVFKKETKRLKQVLVLGGWAPPPPPLLFVLNARNLSEVEDRLDIDNAEGLERGNFQTKMALLSNGA